MKTKSTAIIYYKNVKQAEIDALNNPQTRQDDLKVLQDNFLDYLEWLHEQALRCDIRLELSETRPNDCYEWPDEGERVLWDELQDEGFWAWYQGRK